MARIRNIKPEFWTDSNIVKLSPFARLLYIGMWNFAMCDNGHVEDEPVRLKLQILPMDNVEIGSLLDELLDSNRINRITIDSGETFLHIPSMKKNQKGDPRWAPRCDACKAAAKASDKLAGVSMSVVETPRDSPKLKQNSLVEERRVEESTKDLSTAKAVDEFETWYSGYPKKEAKAAAKKAFIKARKTVSLETLTLGRDNYVASIQGKDRQFIALPASWLNAGRWDDDYGTTHTDGPTVPNQYRMFNP